MKIDQYRDICLIDASLRSYQQTAKENIFAEWDEHTSVMLQMPTGTGKTRLFTSIINDINRYSIVSKQAVKIIVIAHRTELIDQIDKSLYSYSIAHGVIAGGYDRDLKKPVQVASIQTLTNKRNLEIAKKLKADFLIIDEAHHSLARTYKKLWELYPKARKLGVTATPWRMSGSGFVDLFDKLILTKPVKWFIKEKYLSNYQYFSLKQNSDISNTIAGINEFDIEGDYKTSALERTMNTSKIRAQLLDSYLTLAEGKKGIIYAISQLHSKQICEEFEAKDIRIVAIDSKTPKEQRKQLVNDFRHGKLDIIVNVDIFSEGFDCPDIEFVQLARPTCSLAKYLQQVGRALRPVAGKDGAIILDNVGMYERFGLPDARRHWMHHFIGNNSSTELIVDAIKKKGDGVGTIFKMKEGNEPMVLIQQTGDVLGEEEYVEVSKEYKMGPITFESGFVWTQPTHKYINGVHYYEDCHGNKFRMYSDVNSQWHFEINDPKHPGYWKNLIQTSVMHVSEFSIACNAAKLSGSCLQFIGLNVTADNIDLLDFVDPSTKEMVYFNSGEGEQWNSIAEYIEEHPYVEEDDDNESDYFDENGNYNENGLGPALSRLFSGEKYLPDGKPIALLDYDIEERGFGRYAIIAVLNNGIRETLYQWNGNKDFSKRYEQCVVDGVPFLILGVWRSVGYGGKVVMCYTQDNTAEESLLIFDEFGMYYDELATKQRRINHNKKNVAEKKKKQQDSKKQEKNNVSIHTHNIELRGIRKILQYLKESNDKEVNQILFQNQISKKEFYDLSLSQLLPYVERHQDRDYTEEEIKFAIEKWAIESSKNPRKQLKYVLDVIRFKNEQRLHVIIETWDILCVFSAKGAKKILPYLPTDTNGLYTQNEVYEALELYANKCHSEHIKRKHRKSTHLIIDEVPEPKLNMRKRRKRISENISID